MPMQVNISNLETNMCSNTFNQEFIEKQAERQFGNLAGDEGVLQVVFHKIKNNGLYDVNLRLDTAKKNYSSSASASTASKSFSDAMCKIDAQINKQRSVCKSRAKTARGNKVANKMLEATEEDLMFK